MSTEEKLKILLTDIEYKVVSSRAGSSNPDCDIQHYQYINRKR